MYHATFSVTLFVHEGRLQEQMQSLFGHVQGPAHRAAPICLAGL
jgi:hypothetical protein